MSWKKRRDPSEPLPDYGRAAFSGFADYRYGEQRPVRLAGQKQEKPIYGFGKRKYLVARTVEAMSDWHSSPFEMEGPFRSGIRAALCLEGHSWRRADAEAAFLVGRALLAIGIPRPSYDEGQRTYSDNPDRCSWCAADIDTVTNGQGTRYCSVVCAKSALASREIISRDQIDTAHSAAMRVIRKSRMTSRSCAECGAEFKPFREKSTQTFCSYSCGSKSKARKTPPKMLAAVSVMMACAYCGSDFEARHRRAILCSKACKNAWGAIRKGKESVQLRPHVFDRYITSKVEPATINPARLDFLMWQAGCTFTDVAVPMPRVTDALFAGA